MIGDIHIQAILDASHDGIIAVDHDYTIIWVNQNATEILGLPPNVVGEKITRYIPNSDMLRILATGKKEIGDIATVLNRQIIINRLPIVVEGEVVGAVSTFKEITDIQKMELRIRKQSMESGLEAKFRLEDIVGQSKAMREAKEWAETFAKTDATVLIQGETGTGKELFAQGIHLSSQRATGPFIAVNCAALPGNLLESELFGYEEGAFTGARKGGKPGLFELAHGGTLFLDEIGEMSITIQALLLRVLQEKKVRRISGERIVPVDVRIIAATNRNLEQLMAEKLFRSDLYYRLNVLTLELPPLRERTEDIPLLMEAIMEEIAQRGDRRLQGVDESVYRFLAQYDWPGNVRELRNVVERMVLLCKSDRLGLEDTLFLAKKLAQRNAFRQQEQDEAEVIRKVLEMTKGNKGEAAKLLGMDRTTLWRKMKKYGEVD
ncbi:sigma-54 interaction domain-containing protein [Brevibacillus agri]|uniref:sigma-54 interaction domain-containing protein n=1 Tax=Brevibacillus agri TaxID=51101 RepID=UPI0018CD1597|nr:sigma 54-interacting transcriptional regulator [Brevibacillus agri]MBG9564612.1 transcriptional regulator [Brevibacillus agri]MCG5252341.1 sigma 54-interacting transcriptional regulator [Brevibacillus agri]MDN4091303.1 sigma 54-interacting transcriptional regulator [Brevibacillus agri]MDR9503816.1 sigma 54-interacting transcriptional regulator [Brevibacillus agri]MED3497818.1 sigma 54-interacting transcriptional regulator [Brevibacillus agri]